jgi:retinol dehydrogenase-12
MQDEPKTMMGKTCLITGGTSGIGEITARELARKGATVVVVGRSRQRCDATIARIREATGSESVAAMVADLSAQAEVRRLAQEFRSQCPKLDVLINNAGAIFTKRHESPDGIELTFALNHLAYFLLTDLLLDTLKASAPARVVNVASFAHTMVKGINFDDIESRKRYRGFPVYGMSKLANILFSRELSHRLAGTGVTSNSLHPGFVRTRFTEGKGLGWAFGLLEKAIAISPEEGAKTSIYLASSPEVEGVSGKYFVKSKEATPSRAAQDDEAARRLWDLSVEMTGQNAAPR